MHTDIRPAAHLPRLHIEPLRPEHLDSLAQVLMHPLVHAHIDDTPPPPARFRAELEHGLAGPVEPADGEHWLHFLVRNGDGDMLGRLEATVHHGIAEVAFLFGPAHWGRGYATEGLQWLHAELAWTAGVTECWAATRPANLRSRRLLLRCGYRPAEAPDGLPLYSRDPDDLVFCRTAVRTG
ncbi:GNAT family N-acetyltransferase [Ideonella sp.]|uniref:GNAT family N-acetyltransferase n=1 Tax=Ideonella sp. TaxID=1929293 RepID=UPI0035AE366B